MKTPKEYADELIERFKPVTMDYISYLDEMRPDLDKCKQCALISVEHQRNLAILFAEHLGIDHDVWHLAQLEYFDQVKEEIEKA